MIESRFQVALPICRDLSTRLGQDIEDLLLHLVDVLRCVAFPGHYLEGMPPEYMKDELAKERHDKERIACVVRGLQSGARLALDLRRIDT